MQREGDWVLEDVDGARIDDVHGWLWLTGYSSAAGSGLYERPGGSLRSHPGAT